MIIPPANAGPEMMPWVRAVNDSIRGNASAIERLTSDTNNNLKQLNGSVELLGNQVRALPEVRVGFNELRNFGLSSGIKFVQFNITVPPNKNTVSMSIQGNVQVLDTTSGGLAVANAYIEVNGLGVTWTTPLYSASKDTGASAVNNIIAASTGFKARVVPGNNLLVAMTINATNIFAFPTFADNFGTLVATAIFTSE